MATRKNYTKGRSAQPAAKKGPARSAPAKPAPKTAQKKNWTPWIVAGVLVVAVAAGLVFASGGKGGAGFGIPSAEAKYMGRLLPAKYAEPSIAGAQTYTSAVKMTDLTVTDSGTQLSVPVAQVVSDKIVYFEYKKAGGDAIPLMAYVKPSGKLFVGVSYCPPCQGKGQRIESDGTLTCETCGTKRTLENGVGVSGACKLYPLDELPVSVTGGKIVLDKSALDSWTPQPLDRPTTAS
jgi:hypothetical protein